MYTLMLPLLEVDLNKALPFGEAALYGLKMLVVGMLIIFAVLATLWLSLEISGRIFKKLSAKPAAPAPVTTAPETTPAPTTPAPTTPAPTTPAPTTPPDPAQDILDGMTVEEKLLREGVIIRKGKKVYHKFILK